MPDKMHSMDALTATKPLVFVLDIKTIPTLCHPSNQLRQKSSPSTIPFLPYHSCQTP